MSTPTIPAGNLFMNATLFTGNGSTQTIINGVAGQSFQPDLVWVKSRSNAQSNYLIDSNRGGTWLLRSETTGAETFDNSPAWITSFNSNGFSSDAASLLSTGYTYVGWQWKAGGTAVSNTSGTITSSVSANTTSGFSVVTYTSTTGTVGHGLGVAPQMIIIKPRNNTDQWTVGHVGLGGWQYGIPLNTTAATQTNTGFWNSTAPTSSVFSVGSWSNGFNMVAYCWAPIAGYSAFGSYTGNGSADGPFIYTGFRPRFVMWKPYSSGSYDWVIVDTSRDLYNPEQNYLLPDTSGAEGNIGALLDILSNGFKLRTTSAGNNTSGVSVIYAAFAENPFKYANAR